MGSSLHHGQSEGLSELLERDLAALVGVHSVEERLDGLFIAAELLVGGQPAVDEPHAVGKFLAADGAIVAARGAKPQHVRCVVSREVQSEG